MPGQVRAALEPGERRVVVVVVDRRRHAAAVRLVDAAGTRAVLRTDFLLDIAVPPRAAGDRQHLRDEIEIDRGEPRGLLVPALQILAEVGIVAAGARVERRLTRGHVRQANRTAGEGRSEVCLSTGRDRLLIEVHVVLDLKVFPEGPDEAAQAPVVRRRYP